MESGWGCGEEDEEDKQRLSSRTLSVIWTAECQGKVKQTENGCFCDVADGGLFCRYSDVETLGIGLYG